MAKPKDWTGQKFGKLTFIKPIEKRYHNNIVWELLCECGNTTYSRGRQVASGHVSSCGCMQARRYEPIISSARGVWKAYKELDFEIFYALSQQNCDYCGSPPGRTYNVYTSAKSSGAYSKSDKQLKEGDFTYNGLDRVDNSKRHTPDNVVPCCWDCNNMKSNKTREEFLAHIAKINAHSNKSNK